MSIVKQVRNRYLVVSDIVLLIAAVYLCYWLRLDNFDLSRYWPGFIFFAGLAILVTPLVFYIFGVYSRYWIYASIDEMLLLSGAVTTAAMFVGAASLAIVQLVGGASTLPRSIPFIFWPLALAFTAGPRFAIRLSAQYLRRRGGSEYRSRLDLQPVLVMGAGYAGAMIVREMRNNPDLGMQVVGFLDDDPRKLSARIHGVPVLGDRRAIPGIVQQTKAQLVIIAMPTAPGKDIREIVGICEKANVKTKIIPGMYELLDGTVSVNQLRNVEIEDLLRREPVKTDIAAVRDLIVGKCILVTGGGGSIGGELCRQILRCNPSELVVLGHGENSVFEIVSELQRFMTAESRRREYPAGIPDAVIHPVIADIRFPDRLHAVFEQYRPEVVFHAAAHKHVPLMEMNPTEAITNNVFGTRNLLDASLASGVGRFVMISTDKAVKPTSIMGASKRLAELLVHHAAWQAGKPYVPVRFGNVLGSRGSAVLTFKQQIAAGGPVTVTHPDMQRFFMTIPEAVQLVLQAAVLGRGGEVFMLDMGEPIRIVDLARDLIELSGLEVGRDIDIAYVGIRPGEKLYEELFIPGEDYRRTQHDKIFMIGNVNGQGPSRIAQVLARLESSVQHADTAAIIESLQSVIPEFDPCRGAAAVNVGRVPMPVDSRSRLPQ